MTESERNYIAKCEEVDLIPCRDCAYFPDEFDDSICHGCRYGASGIKQEECKFTFANVEQKAIQDSGSRREFSTGAVRDIAYGKGRCDLLPIDVLANFLNDGIMADIAIFIERGSRLALWDAFASFQAEKFPDMETALIELSKHYEDGCVKYGERNWEKGIPIHCYIDSAVRHYLKFKRGDEDERHDRAFLWNIIGALWTLDHRPDLDDMHGSKE